MVRIIPRQEPLVTRMEQSIRILNKNYVEMFSKFELLLELGKQRDTVFGGSSLYLYIIRSFFKEIILAIARLFEKIEDRNQIYETIHLRWALKKHEEVLAPIKDSHKQSDRNKIKEFNFYKSKVKNYSKDHLQVFELRNRILAHSDFLYEYEIKELYRRQSLQDIRDALNIAGSVIKYLIQYYDYDYQNFRINTEIIASAKHDIGLFTKVLEEEAEFLRIQFAEYQNERETRAFWLESPKDEQGT